MVLGTREARLLFSQVCLLEGDRRQTEGAAEPSSDHDWKAVWKLEVPPKIRVLWWRVLHEFLPTKYTLHRRHIERTAHCEVCGADEESIKHVLMDCTIARLFWDSTKHITGVKLPRLHEMTWARDLLQPDICPRKHAAIIICGTWSLWALFSWH